MMALSSDGQVVVTPSWILQCNKKGLLVVKMEGTVNLLYKTVNGLVR